MVAGSGGDGLFSSLKRLAATVVAIGRTRLELLVTELEEEKLRLGRVVVFAIAALFFLGLGIVAAIGFLVALFWEDRVLVLGIAALALVAAGALCARIGAAAVRRGSPLFAASMAELDADLRRLKGEGE